MYETQTLETLKSLRLSAMAEVYVDFLRLGPSDSRTTSELIAEMAEAEWNAKWNRKTKRLLKKAQLRIPASLVGVSLQVAFVADQILLRYLLTSRGVIEIANKCFCRVSSPGHPHVRLTMVLATRFVVNLHSCFVNLDKRPRSNSLIYELQER